MGLFDKLFGSKKKLTADETFLKNIVITEEVNESIQIFRDKTKDNNIKLSLTDKEIVYISHAVFKYFPQVAENREEKLEPHILFGIAESFLYKYQMMGNDFYISHLQYELDKYGIEGLRQDYIDKGEKWSYKT